MEQFSIEQNASGVPFIRYQGVGICTVANMAAFIGLHFASHPALGDPVEVQAKLMGWKEPADVCPASG